MYFSPIPPWSCCHLQSSSFKPLFHYVISKFSTFCWFIMFHSLEKVLWEQYNRWNEALVTTCPDGLDSILSWCFTPNSPLITGLFLQFVLYLMNTSIKRIIFPEFLCQIIIILTSIFLILFLLLLKLITLRSPSSQVRLWLLTVSLSPEYTVHLQCWGMWSLPDFKNSGYNSYMEFSFLISCQWEILTILKHLSFI